ncbi:iron uptake system protein EfeO [Stenotrophomonas sp.]|uniref:iron uptake system protein EfeO n=1 Tax=Stenotrophomonas sp. TaxID=69392 RepID=UPI002D535B20|nr:iron uptake system protein EfeO [Stenotrophomonas sp.]HYQ22736.1 iron uptake system protein EfeO [Stenotrophomonas sp.]
MSPASRSPSLLLRLAVGGSGLLALAALGAFWWASNKASQRAPDTSAQTVTVTIEGNACTPNDITVPAGRTTFAIVNHSQRALEWEILDGVMVVEERENIAPGFTQTMTVKLQPGTYEITCGLLSNPRGTLTVTPSAASDAEAARPSLVAYVGALAEYRVYLVLEAGTLQDLAAQLREALAAGDRAQAQALHAQASASYGRIEPMAELFADLDTALNARAAYYEKREADPAFSGLHRVQAVLAGTADVAALKAAVPVAERLQSDAGTLGERLRQLEIPPQRLSVSNARLLHRVADYIKHGRGDIAADEVAHLQGLQQGTAKIQTLLAPLLAKAKPALQQDIASQLTTLGTALELPAGDDETAEPAPAVALPATQRVTLAAQLQQLAAQLDQVNAALGLE